jgi:hypothetical protein
MGAKGPVMVKLMPPQRHDPWCVMLMRIWCCLTPKLTGAEARSAQGTDMGHEHAEGMAHVGVHVERTVRLVANACPVDDARKPTRTRGDSLV